MNLAVVGNYANDVGNWRDVQVREVGMTPEHAPSPGPASGGQGMSRLNPAALPVADAARVLTRLGGKPVTEAMLHADIGAGSPANTDGSINLVHYAAWLVKELSAGGD